MDNPSSKHHFIPEFYQKGFYSNDGKLFTYKKDYHTIKSRAPAQILYELDLHTIALGKEKTLAIENFYSQLEGKFTECRDLIKEHSQDVDLMSELMSDPTFMKIAKYMVATQFWRTPCKRDLAVEFTPRLTDLYDQATNEMKAVLRYDRMLIKYLTKRAHKDHAVKFIQFILLPLITFDLSEKSDTIYLFRAPTNQAFVSSDRPVSFDSHEKLFSFKSFCFPFSKELLLFGSENDKAFQLSMEKINKLIAKRADKIVIAASKNQLEEIRAVIIQTRNKPGQMT
ncbi:DUF4238 domain-containing protein [Pseudomonas veronii]|uniref:DUF4238 domain-containing protein n=1 Tax=Pseudomonas veronii TaxID=76761 RepID=UPI00061DB4FB|nr:DUF4238 domain-containing protein [Pseudomonas veronii]